MKWTLLYFEKSDPPRSTPQTIARSTFFLVGDNTLIFHLDLGNKKTRTQDNSYP
jgi:hypothetical protein